MSNPSDKLTALTQRNSAQCRQTDGQTEQTTSVAIPQPHAIATSFYMDCKENIVDVSDVYNISVAQVLHLDNSSLKDLFWEHFVKALKP